MATRKKTTWKTARKTSKAKARRPRKARTGAASTPQAFLDSQLKQSAVLRRPRKKPMTHASLTRLLRDTGMQSTVDPRRLLRAVNLIKADAAMPEARLPEEVRETHASLRSRFRSFHGAKVSLAWFPRIFVWSRCADKFGYMTPRSVRNATKLPFNAVTQALLNQLGDLVGNPGRETMSDSTIPAGFTYAGQFIDHDVTLDISSTLDSPVDAGQVNNMRTPALDLDSVYGRGPALDPFLYAFPPSGPQTAIKPGRRGGANGGQSTSRGVSGADPKSPETGRF